MKTKSSLSVLCFLGILSLASPAVAENGTIKGALKSIVTDVVSSGKDALTGATEGMDAGRKEGESADKAHLVTEKSDFERLVSVTVMKVENLGEQKFQLTLAIRNDNDFPVRITNLSEVKTVVLLDKDGFSYPLASPLVQGKDITALGKSLTRVRYTFHSVEGEPAVLRLFEVDLSVPKPVVTTPAQ